MMVNAFVFLSCVFTAAKGQAPPSMVSMHWKGVVSMHWKGVVSLAPDHFRPPFLMGLERWSGTFICPIRLPENDASLRVITSGVLRASILDIPRLDVKGVAVELVNDAIKHAFLTLGYAAATSDQDKAVREFLEGKDVFISLPTGEGKSLCFATLAVFDFLNTISQSVLATRLGGGLQGSLLRL